MTVEALLEIVTRWSFVLLGALATADYLRHRDRDRLDIALMFASIGGGIFIQEVVRLFAAESRWTQTVTSILIVAQPYLLLRLVDHFRPLPLWSRLTSLAGFVASAFVLAAIPEPRPAPATLVVVAYFGLVESYAAAAFIRGALRTSGVSHIRLSLIAWGSGLLAAAIFAAGLAIWHPSLEAITGSLVMLLAVGCGLCYYLGFAPPTRLRRAWRLAELHRFLQHIARLPVDERARETPMQLCVTAGRMTSGLAQAALLPEVDGRALVVRASSHSALAHARLEREASVLWDTWDRGQPAILRTRAQFGNGLAPVAIRLGAHAAHAVPIATPEHRRGLLLVLLHRVPLFAKEHLELLVLMAEQAALILEHAGLVDEQRALVRRLEAANQELEAFSYSVSHDLRAPLRSIDGFSQALLEDYPDRLDPRGVDYLQRLRAGSQRMGVLIDDLLRLSRVTRAEMRREVIDLTATAEAIAAALRHTAPERGATFHIQPGLKTVGDPRLLRVALENLLGNAWKFTAKRAAATIEFGATERNGADAFFVRDNGAGFDMAYAEKLFTPFQRLHGTTEFEGTGIGLATVQRIMARHGGQIWAEAAPDRGATFYFTLPAAHSTIGGRDGQQIHPAG